MIFCLVFTKPSYSADFWGGDCFSPLTWEEHVFINGDESFVVTLVSFFVSGEPNACLPYLDMVVLSTKVEKVLLYPGAYMYEDIKNISFSESRHPSETTPQNVQIVRVNFRDTIWNYGRYSFAILLTFDKFIHTEGPFLKGKVTRILDYPIWLHSCENEIDSVPIGLYSNISQIMEGVRSVNEFPRLTISFDRSLTTESISPEADTEFDGLPYTFGICQEKRNGEPTRIHTGFMPAILISQNFTLEKGETMSMSLYTMPFLPDEVVRDVIGTSLDEGDRYHTLGWFDPPSRVYLKNYHEGWDPLGVASLVITVVFTIIGVPSIWRVWKKWKEKKREEHRNIHSYRKTGLLNIQHGRIHLQSRDNGG